MPETLDSSAIADDLLDRQSVVLPDGRTLTLIEDPDYDWGFSDFADCYGRIAHIRRGDREYATRPDGFDGFARKVWTHDGECYWWQPPDDLRTAKRENALVEDAHGVIHRHPYAFTDPVRSLQGTVQDLLNFGCVVLTVEVDKACDDCQRPQTIGSASLGGVEAMTGRENMLYIVAELVGEALADAES